MTTSIEPKAEEFHDEDVSWARDLATALAEGQAAQAELDTLRQYFMLALSRMPKMTMKVTLTEQMRLGDLNGELEVKYTKDGAAHFRLVKA